MVLSSAASVSMLAAEASCPQTGGRGYALNGNDGWFGSTGRS